MRGAGALVVVLVVVPLAGAAGALDVGDPLRGEQYALDLVNAPEAWEVATGTGVRVAVVDSGVDHAHHDLVTRVDPVAGSSSAEPFGSLAALPVGPWSTSQDAVGHGTNVAGVVAAERGNGLGLAGVSEATVVPVKVEGVGVVGNASMLAAGIGAALDAGVDVVQVSVSTGDASALERVLERAEREGVLVVAAAGNQGQAEPRWPAAAGTVVAVGAVDEHARVWEASNGGVDVVAPGVDVWTTSLGNGFEQVTGTSVAAPVVSGVGAMMLEACPDVSPGQAREALNATAIGLGTGGSGWGLVQADGAVAEVACEGAGA